MRCGEGFIICYSITDRHSFVEAEEYRNLIQKVKGKRTNNFKHLGNTCGLAGRVVVSNTKRPGFESSHQHLI